MLATMNSELQKQHELMGAYDMVEHLCHLYQGQARHWKRNSKEYLEDLTKKRNKISTSGIHVIEVNLSISSSWVLDTGCASHICTNVQALRNSRALTKGEIDLRVGNGARVTVVAIGTNHLSLPSGLVLELDDCCYVPALTKNIISVSCLDKKGFSFIIKNKCCSVYLNDMFFCSAPLIDRLYILDLENSIYNISTKRFKLNELNQTYL